MACCNSNLDMDAKNALKDAQCVIQSLGGEIKVRLVDEETVERDEFGSIKRREANFQTIKAFPIEFNPATKNKDRNGIKESVEVMATTAMQDWIDLGYSDRDISHIDSIRAEFVVRGQTYEVRDKNLVSQYGETFLYVVLGLNRK